MFVLRNVTLRFTDIVIRNANETHDPAGAFLPDVHGGVVTGSGHRPRVTVTVQL